MADNIAEMMRGREHCMTEINTLQRHKKSLEESILKTLLDQDTTEYISVNWRRLAEDIRIGTIR